MENSNGLAGQIEREIQQYFQEVVNISDSYDFSQQKLVRRIQLFESQTYPTGKFDSQKNYKFWYDIIGPRVDAEVKNVDFDTKDVIVEPPQNTGNRFIFPALVTNIFLKRWLQKTGQAEELNSAIEEGSGWGNVLWKRVNKGYERADLKNVYIINQTAQTVDDTPIIERHQFSQSDLRSMGGKWDYIEEVVQNCSTEAYSNSAQAQEKSTTTPYYEIYERNGEVSLSDLKEAKGEEPSEGDDKIYLLAKVIAAGKKNTTGTIEVKYILFADKLGKKMSDIYKEYHRGRYKGRWWREGLYELLFDLQVRANQIGNQMAQGLEWASKVIFRSGDKLIVQNILTDLRNGDLIRSQDIQQVEVRMQGFEQLANEYNRILQLANDISNSQEVVQAVTPASGTPLGTTQLLNVNANKLYDFIREKFAIPLTEIFERWIVPDLISNLKLEDILRISGDSEPMDRLYNMIVDDWYARNQVYLPPHTKEIADTLKEQKKEELKKSPQILVSGMQKALDGFKPNVTIVITGENTLTDTDVSTISGIIGLEADPERRSYMIDEILKKKGFDVAKFPKRIPAQPAQPEKPVPVTA